MRVRTVIRIICIVVAFAIPVSIDAQNKSEGSKVTPQTARKKEAEALEKKQSEYQSRKDHHLDVQDKATRKRMKKNLRKARRQSWGKNVPWYKRWFRRQ
jgi:hypothetical protein